MTEKDAYIEISQRFIESCREHLNKGINIQEAVGFKSYHAFESIGGAVNCHLGFTVPWKHERKLTAFVHNYNVHRFSSVNPATIAQLAIALNAMRNKYLYPQPTPLGHRTPQNQVSITNVRQLVSKINGIINRLSSDM